MGRLMTEEQTDKTDGGQDSTKTGKGPIDGGPDSRKDKEWLDKRTDGVQIQDIRQMRSPNINR